VSRSRLRLLAVAASLSILLTGCSASKIERQELESKAASALEREIGALPEVRCGADLAAEVDATTECVAVAPGSDEELPITITVTAVQDGRADFEIVTAN
jgi:Domain of unknown function (DUF4333)